MPNWSGKPIDQQVREIIVEQLCVDEDEITPESTWEDLGADSMDTVEFIMALEERLDIEIPDEEAAEIQNVQQVIDYITRKVG
jgi:acyl carrier protein